MVFPVLLAFILFTIDVGRLFWTYVTISRATAATARCAAIRGALPLAQWPPIRNPPDNTCFSFADLRNYAVAMAWKVPIMPDAFVISYPTCGAQVTATYALESVAYWITVELTASSCFPFSPPP